MQVASLDHVNLVTTDLSGTVAFYRAVLGLTEAEVPAMPPGYVVRWLADAAGRPIFHIQEYNPDRHPPEVCQRPTGPIDHVALRCEDFAGMIARCEAMGLRYRVSDVPGRTFRQLFLTDPNGIVLELNFPQ